MQKEIYRVLDANFNRVREGLRVCEEFVRFFLNDKGLTSSIKRQRNKIGRLYSALYKDKRRLLSARDVKGDVGREGFPFERDRSKVLDVFWANMQRSKEALRVLEEFSKLIDIGYSDQFRRLRFKIYGIEKEAFRKMQTLSNSG